MWILTEVYPFFEKTDPHFAKNIINSVKKLLSTVKENFPLSDKTEIIYNRLNPTWLPKLYASDQASVIILGLTNYLNEFDDPELLQYMKNLQNGILMMHM